MVKPPTKHLMVYVPAAAGLVGFLTWTLVNSTLGYPWQLWFTDMMDGQNVKAYERPMAVLPDGAVSRNAYVANFDRTTPEGQALTHTFTVDEAFVKKGEWGYQTYCAPCHKSDATGMGPVTDNSDGKKRFQIPGLPLAGTSGVLSKRTDGYLYLTIRNGGAIMPSYNWALEENEMWAIVAYLRTLPNSAYVPPAPATEG